ncbi:lunapark protein [Sarcoptes scabiei]|nr:lunapark protein [Sarcoptes scabiei]
MSSAYGENRDDQKEDCLMLTSKQLNLPVYYHSKEIQSREFILDCYNEADFDGLFEIFEEIIEDGRSSHLANYGLIVASKHRNLGLGKFMGKECIRLARLLGFKALYTNLVYANNRSSISICQCLGFRQVGRIPNGGHLKNLGYVDALQFYRELDDCDTPKISEEIVF